MDVSSPLVLQPGWGNLYQGAAADQSIVTLERDLWIVCMNYGEVDDSFVDRLNIKGLTVIAIQDSPDAVITDYEVFANVEADVAWLKRGKPRIRHCGAGVSRASYGNLATIMHVKKMPFGPALEYLRTVRPQANPNPGFTAHLIRLEPQLLQNELP